MNVVFTARIRKRFGDFGCELQRFPARRSRVDDDSDRACFFHGRSWSFVRRIPGICGGDRAASVVGRLDAIVQNIRRIGVISPF
jgi:hypothetical protein